MEANRAANVAAAAGPRRPRTDVLTKKDQDMERRFREDKHLARMAQKERHVPALTKNKELEAVVYKYNRSERTGIPKEDILKQDLMEVGYNDVGDRGADILWLLQAKRDGKDVKKLPGAYIEYQNILRNMWRKRRIIEDWDFVLPPVPSCFNNLPALKEEKPNK